MKSLTAQEALALYKSEFGDKFQKLINDIDSRIYKGVQEGKTQFNFNFTVTRDDPDSIVSKISKYYEDLGYMTKISDINPEGPWYQLITLSISFSHLLENVSEE